MKRLRINVEGKTYEVEVELLDKGISPTTASQTAYRPTSSTSTTPVSSPKQATASVNSAGPKDVTSPLTAVVVAVDVAVGDAIEEGQGILTLEAMKMNTVVNATTSGVVKTLAVNLGDAVEEGQIILSVE
ncbi:MAG: biotin/lipoyl-containing protein [Verrucomicrobiota bacterium]